MVQPASNEGEAINKKVEKPNEIVEPKRETAGFQAELDRDRDSASRERANSPDSTAEAARREANQKAVADTGTAARSGDLDKLQSGINSAFEKSIGPKGSPEQFKDFAKQLNDELKESGIKVESKDGQSISFEKGDKKVDFKLDGQIDQSTGKLSVNSKIESSDGKDPQSIIKGFADKTDERKPVDTNAIVEKKPEIVEKTDQAEPRTDNAAAAKPFAEETAKALKSGDMPAFLDGLKKTYESFAKDPEKSAAFVKALNEQFSDQGMTVLGGEKNVAITRAGSDQALSFDVTRNGDAVTIKPQTYDYKSKENSDGDPKEAFKNITSPDLSSPKYTQELVGSVTKEFANAAARNANGGFMPFEGADVGKAVKAFQAAYTNGILDSSGKMIQGKEAVSELAKMVNQQLKGSGAELGIAPSKDVFSGNRSWDLNLSVRGKNGPDTEMSTGFNVKEKPEIEAKTGDALPPKTATSKALADEYTAAARAAGGPERFNATMDKLSKAIEDRYKETNGTAAEKMAAVQDFAKQIDKKTVNPYGLTVSENDGKLKLSMVKGGDSPDMTDNGKALAAKENPMARDGTQAKYVAELQSREINKPVDKSITNGARDQASDTAKKPVDTLLDPKASPEDKLRAAHAMAIKGDKEFSGPDGRKYYVTSQSYGKRDGVIVATTDERGKFMPVLRGLVDDKGNVSHQRKHRHDVDYAGNHARKVMSNDPVLTSAKTTPEVEQKKPRPKQEENKEEQKPKPPEEQPEKQKPKVPEDQPEKHKPGQEDKQTKPSRLNPEGEQKGPLGTTMIPVDKPQESVTTIASVYSRPQATMTGSRYFNPNELTAAVKPEIAKKLGLTPGDVIQVTHNGKSVNVVYTDAGPFVKGRGVDLSRAAGKAIGITVAGAGTGQITFKKIGREPAFRTAPG